METNRPLQSIPDDQLLHHLGELMGQHRRVEADVIAYIAEVDDRRLFAREAFPSMFVYCTHVLHFSEAEAYLRITAARASREHPVLLTMLADARLHLTAIALLAPHLTRENREALLERATHRSKRQVQELIAEIAPRPDVPTRIRKVPLLGASPLIGAAPPCGPQGSSDEQLRLDGAAQPIVPAPVGPAPQAVIQPLSPGRYKVQFTASAELHEKLKRLQALMNSKVPKGDLAAVIEQAVTEKLERLEKLFARPNSARKGLATEASISPSSRYIPAAVRRAVVKRDGGQCRYADAHGRRCPERNRLEYHHRHPFGFGGSHRVDNIRLMCRAHNAYLADHDYGRKAMARHRRPPPAAPHTAAG